MILKNMITSERLQKVNVILTKLDIYGLFLFQKILQINCNRFKQTTKKFYYWRSDRKNFRFSKRTVKELWF